MTEFIVADRLLYGPISRWLDAADGVRMRDSEGVRVYSAGHWNLIIINPEDFSLGTLSVEVRRAMARSSVLNVITGSITQYFASEMKTTAPIFSAINVLAQHPVAVVDAPAFRLQKAFGDASRLSEYKHAVSYVAFPADMKRARTSYVRDGKFVDEKALRLERGVSSVGTPILFHHSAFALQGYGPNDFVRTTHSAFDFERLAFDQLMLRFPSRYARQEELEELKTRSKLEVEDLREIWDHNRAQWQLTLQKLELIGVKLPSPTVDTDSDAYRQFTHLIISNFLKLAGRIDAVMPKIRHIGIPLFARNGVTIPLGEDGIIRTVKDLPTNILDVRVAKILPKILAVDLHENTAKPAEAVVNQP